MMEVRVLSIIIGIIMGYLLFSCFINKPQLKGPDSRNVIGEQFVVDGEIYTFEPIIL